MRLCQGDSADRNTRETFNKLEISQPISAISKQLGQNLGQSSNNKINNLLSVAEAAHLLDLPERSLRRKCESGAIPAIAKSYGAKTRYLISPATVELLFSEQVVKKPLPTEPDPITVIEAKSHKVFLEPWLDCIRKGLLTGKPYSPITVRLYERYGNQFFKVHNTLSCESLEVSLGKIPVHHISKRQNFYKALLCLGKYLIRQKVLDPSFVNEIKHLSPKRHLPPKRHTVTAEQMKSILNKCENPQDTAIIQLLASTGIRNAELCALKLNDIDLGNQVLIVQCGKGGKRRRVGLNRVSAEALKCYLAVRPKGNSPYLFLNRNGVQMDISGLYHRVERIGRSAGIKASPHAFRRAFVTINHNKGKPLVHLQIAAGHSDIKTTRSYCMTTENEVIEAMRGWD